MDNYNKALDNFEINGATKIIYSYVWNDFCDWYVELTKNRIYSSEGVHPALPSQESSGRFWIYHDGNVRKLTIQECYRILGFPIKYKLIPNKSELYKQIGNSVCIPMVKEIGNQIKSQLL